MKIKAVFLFTISIFFCAISVFGQNDRFQVIEQRLKDLSASVPGLRQTAELSISSGSLHEFLRGLASTHNLNINIDPSLNQRVTNYFANEKVTNILYTL
ncbi:MAG: hypothetical protein IPN43_11120 [Chitinophagaceae bacterium]|nr:hypothetical protein [Chitinophagaceae bacterium]